MLNQISDQDTVSGSATNYKVLNAQQVVIIHAESCLRRLPNETWLRSDVSDLRGRIWILVERNFAMRTKRVRDKSAAGLREDLSSSMEVYNWVPTVAYNGKVTELSHTGRAPPLKEILCDLIYNTNPACKTKRRL